MTAVNNNFDGRKFGKLFSLLNSPQDAEAAGALHRMRVMLTKHGMTFYEAVENHEYKTEIWEGFGGPECLRQYFEWKNGGGGNDAALREEAAQLMRKVQELAGLLTQEKEVSAHLRQECARSGNRPAVSDAGLVNGGLVAAVVLAAVALLVAAALH
jgi:hypothetical protein